MYEVDYVDGYIIQPFVKGGVEMSGDFTLRIIFGYLEEVGSKAHFQLTFGLADILYAASFT